MAIEGMNDGDDRVVPLDTPLTVSAARLDDGYITGVIAIDLAEVIDRDLEQFLDLIGARLVEGGELLMDVNYAVVGHGDDGSIYLEVSGDVSMILECRENEEDDNGNDDQRQASDQSYV